MEKATCDQTCIYNTNILTNKNIDEIKTHNDANTILNSNQTEVVYDDCFCYNICLRCCW